MTSNNKGAASSDLSPSMEALVIKNIQEERVRQHRKKYFRVAELIANSVHEMMVQYCFLSTFLSLLHPNDQKRVARELKLDINLCKQIDSYTKSMENLPKKLRDKVLESIEQNMAGPFIEKCKETFRGG